MPVPGGPAARCEGCLPAAVIGSGPPQARLPKSGLTAPEGDGASLDDHASVLDDPGQDTTADQVRFWHSLAIGEVTVGHSIPSAFDFPLGLGYTDRPCEGGGTGRRAGLRIQSFTGWGFNSPSSHEERGSGAHGFGGSDRTRTLGPQNPRTPTQARRLFGEDSPVTERVAA
jgi:hypothetical protein